MLQHIIRPDIQAQTAYAIADIPHDFIKLDAMELPYAFPEALQNELAKQLANAPINRYPNPATCGLRDALRQAFHLPEHAEIALGNGSDELIQLLTMLVAQQGATMLAVEPSFVMYRHNAALLGLNYVGVPLNADFTLNMPAVLEAIATHQPAITFIAYPNNPTGVAFQRDEIQAIISASRGLVVIDEAYGAFSADSFATGTLPEHVVVMRTLSKIGFAGLRVGYALGSAAVMGELAKIVPPYNMNWLSITAARFALAHKDWIDERIAILLAERQRMSDLFSQFKGATVFPSQANFMTVRVPDADALFDALKQHRILVKKLHGSHALLNQCLRLTIGTPEQNDAVLTVCQKWWRECVG